MRQHRSLYHVANRKYSINTGAAMIVYLDPAGIVHGHTGGLRVESVGVWFAADRDHQILPRWSDRRLSLW